MRIALFKATRHTEWWEYKLVPLLAIAYATILLSGKNIFTQAPWLLFFLASLAVGAVYVSVINDLTDLEEDLASGKANRLANMNPKYRWMVPAGCVLAGMVFFGIIFHTNRLSAFLYLMAWVSFSLYSLPPFRFKTRGILGVFADACGSHFFISLLMVSWFMGSPPNWLWFGAVGIWALCYGIRGILWHQFHDRDNDLRIGLNTYAAHIDPASFRTREWLITSLEVLAFLVVLYCIAHPLPVVFLALYLLLIGVRHKLYGIKIIAVLTRPNEPFQILLAEYYQVFLPISLLIAAAINNPAVWFVLVAHIILFPSNIGIVINDAKKFTKKSLKYFFYK